MTDDPQVNELEPRQGRLYGMLHGKSPSLSIMYLGAIRVLSHNENPDRLALSAHGLRELMEKFPEYVDIRIRPPVSMGVKVNELEQQWDRAQESSSKKDDTWTGEIDNKLASFLGNVHIFFAWKKADMPSRTEKVLETLRELDAAQRAMPEPVEKIMAQLWKTLNIYFQKVAHHGNSNTTEEEFRGYLRSLEEFLLDRIDPRTFEVFDEIDDVIAPEDQNAD